MAYSYNTFGYRKQVAKSTTRIKVGTFINQFIPIITFFLKYLQFLQCFHYIFILTNLEGINCSQCVAIFREVHYDIWSHWWFLIWSVDLSFDNTDCNWSPCTIFVCLYIYRLICKCKYILRVVRRRFFILLLVYYISTWGPLCSGTDSSVFNFTIPKLIIYTLF